MITLKDWYQLDFSLPEASQAKRVGIGLRTVEQTLGGGKIIHVPSLGLVITPDGELKRVKTLTKEELRRNPHIRGYK